MARFAQILLVPLGAFALAMASRAETPAVLSDPNAPAASPAPTVPKHERVISDDLALSLAASRPKYNPPPKPRPEDQDVDLRDVDKPKNGIVRLPKYTVRDKRPPVFRERDIYTAGGLADLAKRRYLTPAYNALNKFYIPLFSSSPEEHAFAMYAEQERLDNIADLNDTAQTVSTADAAAGTYIKRAAADTYMRTGDFGYETTPQKRSQ